MARYRTKDDVDLAWNRIRRRITRELDTQIAEWREDTLNELLGRAWDTYKTALAKGEKPPEIVPVYESFVRRALTEAIDVEIEDQAA